ncbi:hypothetical protein [Synoicihabitans lomoniglobus]|uniref:Uncharacterized protein n=1 Tax=Synoicihabitans lomoniglobus TaxID=2909285 RepID=A0AAF0I506_9BACT|nr:hypothetical protein [Opitutaceae bacterium LMO-M01]WED66780.1 hypothetical protein PXH66_07950 [Opitutaceae bacterium LMO-M01]
MAQSTFTYGVIENNQYHAPSGEFDITLPVQPEFGGHVTDTPEVVTFQDNVSIHASIACFGLDSAQKREIENRGRQDYLAGFFGQHVQAQFRERFAGATIESAKFVPALLSGSLIVYNLLPGGSMFDHQAALSSSDSAPTAKRGNLLFLHNDHLYVVSIELADPVIDTTHSALTTEQQNELLQQRLLELVGRMSFRVPVSQTLPNGQA